MGERIEGVAEVLDAALALFRAPHSRLVGPVHQQLKAAPYEFPLRGVGLRSHSLQEAFVPLIQDDLLPYHAVSLHTAAPCSLAHG